MKPYQLVILAMVLAGCAHQQYLWYKNGATKQDFAQDRYACLQESQQRVSGAYVNAYGGAAQNTVRTNQQLFNACMSARGYELRAAPAQRSY